MLLVLNLPLVGLFIRILKAPMKLLMPIILLLCLIGVFAVNSSLADIWIMVICGIAGYGLRRIDFPVAPLVLALVIGPMIEDSLRQSLLLSLGDFRIFLNRPIAMALFLITLAVIGVPPLIHKIRR